MPDHVQVGALQHLQGKEEEYRTTSSTLSLEAIYFYWLSPSNHQLFCKSTVLVLVFFVGNFKELTRIQVREKGESLRASDRSSSMPNMESCALAKVSEIKILETVLFLLKVKRRRWVLISPELRDRAPSLLYCIQLHWPVVCWWIRSLRSRSVQGGTGRAQRVANVYSMQPIDYKNPIVTTLRGKHCSQSSSSAAAALTKKINQSRPIAIAFLLYSCGYLTRK